MPQTADTSQAAQPPVVQPDAAPTVAFYTLGCKTNQLETSTLAGQFRAQGWSILPFDEAANLYVVNTCTVTERADHESKRVIRRAKLSNPDARVLVTGCFAQVAPEELAAQPGVDYVVGNQFKDRILEIIDEAPAPEKPLIRVSDIDKSRIMTGGTVGAITPDGESRTRGSLKIQDGCDYKCTYCIIWEARGPSRSLPVADLAAQLGRMVDPDFQAAAGGEAYKEVVLTGINIGQYQCPETGADLAGLLAALAAIPHDFRLRLTSLDPLEVTSPLIDAVAEGVRQGKICPHFHLSAQSAEDVVLKRMARRHHAADMVAVCAEIAAKIPGCSVGSDIIVGFPGETAERFEATFETLSACAMNYFHVFSYSKRKGTPAASYPDQVPEREKKQRARRLRELSEQKQRAYRERFLGQALTVVVEDSGLSGMSGNYIHVDIDTPTPLPANTWATVHVAAVMADRTVAVLPATISG